MKNCVNCGAQMDDQAVACPSCGAQQNVQQQAAYQQPIYNAPTQPAVNDSGSIGWWFLGFFFPIVGLILFLVWKDSKPLSAKKAGIGALVGFIVGVVVSILYIALFAAIFSSALGSAVYYGY